MGKPAKSGAPKWILIGTGVLGLIGAGLVLVVRYYEINKARAEADLARLAAERARAEFEQPKAGEQNKPPVTKGTVREAGRDVTGKLPGILQQLAGTKWVNSNNTTFEWTEDCKLLHAGKERPCIAVNDREIRIIFSETHVDTLVFDADFNRFEQFSSKEPNIRPLFRGRCVKRKNG